MSTTRHMASVEVQCGRVTSCLRLGCEYNSARGTHTSAVWAGISCLRLGYEYASPHGFRISAVWAEQE